MSGRNESTCWVIEWSEGRRQVRESVSTLTWNQYGIAYSEDACRVVLDEMRAAMTGARAGWKWRARAVVTSGWVEEW